MRAGDSSVELVRKLKLMRAATSTTNMYYAARRRIGKLRGIDHIDSVYTKKYIEGETRITAPSVSHVVDTLMDVFSPSSVVDLGCAQGNYLLNFAERGVDIFGYEGSSHAVKNALIPPDKITRQDLTKPFTAPRQYDLAMSFEVGEHLPKSAAETFVKNIIHFSNAIAYTAAHPGQGGTDHVNEQPQAYWIGIFRKHGYEYDERTSKRLKSLFEEQNCAWWLAKNIMVFRAENANRARRESSAPHASR